MGTTSVVFDCHIRTGMSHKHVKRWAKRAIGFHRPFIPDTQGVAGEFLRDQGVGDFEAALPDGSLLVLGASRPDYDPAYMLVEVKDGGSLKFEDGPYKFYGQNIVRVAYDTDPVDKQSIVRRHPDLASAVGKPLLAILAAIADHQPTGSIR